MNDSTQDADLFPCEGTNGYPWPYLGSGSSSLCWLFWRQVRPSDIIGCNGDRVVVVPLELAQGDSCPCPGSAAFGHARHA